MRLIPDGRDTTAFPLPSMLWRWPGRRMSEVVFHPYDTGDPLFVAEHDGPLRARSLPLVRVAQPLPCLVKGWTVDLLCERRMGGSRNGRVWRIRPFRQSERLTNAAIGDIHRRRRSIIERSQRISDQSGAGPWLWAPDTERKVTRRISSGLEIYSSVDVMKDGYRLVAFPISNPTANPLERSDSRPARGREGRETRRAADGEAHRPRYGGTSLFYLSSRGGDGLAAL